LEQWRVLGSWCLVFGFQLFVGRKTELANGFAFSYVLLF